MKTKVFIGLSAFIAILFLQKNSFVEVRSFEEESEAEERTGLTNRFSRERLQYEFDLIKNPVTGTVPEAIFKKELVFAQRLPVRNHADVAQRVGALNSYLAAGPQNIGGRTRALAYDIRYNNTTN